MTASTITASHHHADRAAYGAKHVGTPDDSDVLRYMRNTVYRHVHERSRGAAPESSEPQYLLEADGRQHRIVVMNGGALQHGGRFAFVGFFGRKRPEADGEALDALDRELMAEFAEFPQLLSYSSLEMTDGSWANLVIMSSPEGAIHWAKSSRHSYAVREVAPRCYSTIRLHSGALVAGDVSPNGLQIQRTKHFVYDDSTDGPVSPRDQEKERSQ